MTNRLATALILSAVLVPVLGHCAPTTAEQNLAAARTSRASKSPAAQMPPIVNREFIAQNAKRMARKFVNSRYVEVREVMPGDIPGTVHTVIVNQQIENADIIYFTGNPIN